MSPAPAHTRHARAVFLAVLAFVGPLPSRLAAQEPERSSFYLILQGDTIFDERVTRTPTSLTGEFLDRLRKVRATYDAKLSSAGLVTSLDVHSYRNVGDTAGDVASFVFAGDTLTAKVGAAAPVKKAGVAGAVALLNPSVAFMEQIVLRARVLGTDPASVPVFIIGAPQPFMATVRRRGADSVQVQYASVSMDLAVSPAGRILGGLIPAQGVRIARGPAGGSLAIARADYSAPPNAPYVAEDVVVTTPGRLKLAGTLTLPKNRPGGKAPAIITITGSGPEDRDEQSGAIPGYRPFRELADTLGRRGIAVLRLDDRGVGGSDAGSPSATSADFADDIRAGIAYLRSRPEIDGARIGIVGHSEGGIIAPMIATTDPEVRAIVLMAGTASTGRAIVMEQNRYSIDSVAHLRGAARDSALARAGRSVDSIGRLGGWLGFFLSYDPTPVARRVKTPVLIVQGETDRQVPPAEAKKLADAIRSGGNRDVTVKMFPATNHLFLADSSGAFADANGLRYGKLPSLHVRPEVLGAIADWLSKHLE